MTTTDRKFKMLLMAIVLMLPAQSSASEKEDDHMKWWREARYGMFIHWGLYSVAGGEWKGKDYGKEQGGASAEWLMNSAKIPGKEYREALAPQFNPTDFDAEKWVSAAKEAGMKYMGMMGAIPFRRDILKELSEECARQKWSL